MQRYKEITARFLSEIDKHLDDLVNSRVERMFEIHEFAELIHVHPVHFSATLKEHTGKTPCCFYQEKIMEVAKSLLLSTSRPISDIAFLLTYDASNFTKTFKRFTGLTPKQYRQASTGSAAMEM